MIVVRLAIKISAIQNEVIICHISDGEEFLELKYYLDEGLIEFGTRNYLVNIIEKYQIQFEKVVRSAAKGNITVGESIHSVFIENFKFLKEEDYNSFIRMDRRNGELSISTSETEMEDVHRIYADGSYNGTTKKSGYGGFIEDPVGNREIFSQSFDTGSSNLMELLAVTDGIERLSGRDVIQVNTDSRFVIRGLIQWVHFWRHNNWQTAFNSDVKYDEHWKKVDQYCEGKLIEFNWIKGHSGNNKQDFCHDLAKKSANDKTT